MRDNPTVWYHTFGCKANQYDTEQIRQALAASGATSAEKPGTADVAVINTCTVTHQAEAKARQLIRRIRRENPDVRIVVAGCSTALREERYAAMPEVDGVVPGHDADAVTRTLAELGALGTDTGETPRAAGLFGTRAWLKVQDGCDRKCSFCATRMARGASVSRDPDEVVREARTLAERHPEIVITGIHIGHYGVDLEPRESLASLCARLVDEVPARIRLSSIEATEIDDALLSLMVEARGRLAPHLHVPMQSGSDRVLRSMRRWHTREAYRSRVVEIAGALGPFGLGADIIVGFPGETDADFEDTRSLVDELPFTYLHVFPHSIRDGTVAASLPDRVPPDVAAERSRALREIAQQKGHRYRESRIGGWADVIVEGATGVGMTGDYLRVAVTGPVAPGGRFTGRLEGNGDGLSVRLPTTERRANA